MRVHMETNGQRIWILAAPTDASELAHSLKQLPGIEFGAVRENGEAAEWARKVVGPGPPVVWTAPLSYRACLDISGHLNGHTVEIHDQLWAWASAERKMRRDLRVISRAKEWPTPYLEREYPELNSVLHGRPYQSVGVAFATRRKRGINGDEPGLGKTLQTAAAVVENRNRGAHLVIAPSSAASITWPDEFERWLPNERYVVVEGDKNKRTRIIEEYWNRVRDHRRERSWMFINPEMLQQDRETTRTTTGRLITNSTGTPRFPALFTRPWSGLFLDEAHRYLPTKQPQAHRQSMVRQGLMQLPVLPSGMKFALTGTPLKGNALNLWGMLNWLYPTQFTAYWAYVERWFDVETNMIGEIEAKTVEGLARSQEKAFGEEIDAVMIRRTKAEVAPDIPPKRYGGRPLKPRDPESPVGVWLPMTPKQEKAYREIVEESVARLESGDLLPGGVLAELTRCKQLASAYGDIETRKVRLSARRIAKAEARMGRELTDEETWVEEDVFRPSLPSNKFDWIVEFLAERGIQKQAWGEQKVVIASQYTNLINLVATELNKKGIPSYLLTGQQNAQQRRTAVREFQGTGGHRVFLLNTDAGGTSLTLDAADDLVFLDEKWNPTDQEQVENRIHRISRVHQVAIWYLRSSGTIDERIAEQNDNSDRVQRKLLDGRRGIEFARELLGGAA